MIVQNLLIFGLGLCLNLVLTPLARVIALAIGLVDQPDGRRKLHEIPIPLAGGPALYTSLILTLLIVCIADRVYPMVHMSDASAIIGLFFGGTLLCGIGILDDARGLRGRYKLLGQIAAVGVVIACGVQVEHVHLFSRDISLGAASVPLTAFFLLGAINSLNLIDGMDGLLGSVAAIVCLAFGVMAVVCGQGFASLVAFAMAGSLVGFLRYNFPPARVYMGDSGSMLVGLVVGVLAIHSSLKGPATLALAAPMCVLIIPILDTMAAIVRRKLAGRSVFITDRGHLHHCLLRSGLSRPASLGVVGGLCLVATIGGVVSIVTSTELVAGIAVLTVVGILLVTRLFGYNEARMILRRMAYTTRFTRPHPSAGGSHISVHLHGSIEWILLWDELVDRTVQSGFQHLRLDIDDPATGESFHAMLNRHGTRSDEIPQAFHIVFPLSASGRVIGRVELAGERHNSTTGASISQLTELVQDAEQTAASLIEGSTPAILKPRLNIPMHMERSAYIESIPTEISPVRSVG